jgi:hypothetical protein
LDTLRACLEDLTKESELSAKSQAPGKIGKLQIMKSGKMFLVSAVDGRRYELTSGMQSSFAQYAASVTTDKPIASSSSTVTIKSEQGVASTTMRGAIHMLGNITQKLVILPEYEIGSRKAAPSKQPSSSSSTAATATAAAGVSGVRVNRSESVGTEISETAYGDERTLEAAHDLEDMDYTSDND